jgi:hypothetical protein
MVIESLLLTQVCGGSALEHRILREAQQQTDKIKQWVTYGLVFVAGGTTGAALQKAFTQPPRSPDAPRRPVVTVPP